MLVTKTVDYAVCLVKSRGDDVEILSVSGVIAPENRVGDMVGYLDQAGCTGVDKERRIGDILERPPSCSHLTKFAAELLQGRLVRAFVENQQPAIPIAFLALAGQKRIESLTQIFKGHLDRI